MDPKIVFYFVKKHIVLIAIGLILIYDLGTFVEYKIGVPQTKTKIKTQSKTEEILEIEKNTELVQNKIRQDKIRKEAEEEKAREEEYEKSLIPTNEEIKQSKQVYKVIKYWQKPDKKAVDILYNYIMEENKHCAPVCTESISSKDKYYAYFVDLNDDGVNEVIGMVNDMGYRGWMGYSVFLIKKTNNGYIVKDFFSHSFEFPIKILKHKTNGYHDIMFESYDMGATTATARVLQYFGTDYYLGYILETIK